MSAAQLITDLARLGIRIKAHGDRLRYSPRSAVTPDLADRMKAHKGKLLAILRRDPDSPAEMREAVGVDDWTDGTVNPDDVTPCPQCGSHEAWQTLPGDWRCLRCDPPTTARQLRQMATRLRTERT
jgi:hypothetical protein